jgi:hypothetical protein
MQILEISSSAKKREFKMSAQVAWGNVKQKSEVFRR